MSQSTPPPLHPVPTAKKGKKALFLFGITCGVTVMLLFVAFLALAVWPDVELADDSDLIPHAEAIAAAEPNPAAVFEERFQWKLTSEESSLVHIKAEDRTEEDWEALRELVESKAETLKFLRDAVEVPGWKHNQNYDFTASPSHLNALRISLLLMKNHALLSLQEGNTDAAVTEAGNILYLATRIEEGGGNLIYKLIASAGNRIGQETILEILEDKKVTTDNLVRVEQLLMETKLQPDDFADAYRVEYQTLKNLYADLAAGNINPDSHPAFQNITRGKPAFFQPNKTTNQMAEFMRYLIRNATAPPDEKIATAEVMKTISKVKENWLAFYISPNAIGNRLSATASPAYVSISDSHTHSRAVQDLIRLKIAALKFLYAEKRSITSLDELIPNYIKQIPIDPFDGKPLRFNPKTRMASSIGSDLIDDQGKYIKRDGARAMRNKLPHQMREEPALRLP